MTAPNPDSIHRLAAVMGSLTDADVLSGRGRRYDSRPLLDLDGMLAPALATELEPTAGEGIMIKPLPNALMVARPGDVIKGLVLAARHFPTTRRCTTSCSAGRPERATA